ncbi:MAG: hypothetical protein ACKVJK_10525 [Methylophagaceae bacterium]
MKKQLLILIAFFSISNLYAQDIFIGTGKNFTSYDYAVSDLSVSTPDYRSVSGSFYEIGYSPNDPDKNLSYLVSLTYNEFNAAASKDLSSYSWNTCYLGLQNAIEYSFFESKSGIKLSINAGLNTAHITKGEQFINTAFYDITDDKEFTGLLLQGIVGLSTKYDISNDANITLGCNLSKANAGSPQLTMNTLQFKLGLHYHLKEKKSKSGFTFK